MRIIYSVLLCVALILACCISFLLGKRHEEGNRHGIAQQFRGWSALASLSSRLPLSNERLREKYELLYFFESKALAANLEHFQASDVAEFKLAARKLPDVIVSDRLHEAARALSLCVERNSPGGALVDCLDKDVPAVKVNDFVERKVETVGG